MTTVMMVMAMVLLCGDNSDDGDGNGVVVM